MVVDKIGDNKVRERRRDFLYTATIIVRLTFIAPLHSLVSVCINVSRLAKDTYPVNLHLLQQVRIDSTV
jgi:hypothetical protein